MNGLIFSATGQFFWALIGALLGYGLPYLFSWWNYRRRPGLIGEWQSTYQGIDEPSGTWVKERIAISISGKRLKFKNADSSHGYDYTAFGKVLKEDFIVGEWISVRKGANAHGGFILTIAAQGDALYGYWVGPDFSGTRRYGRWVLAKTSKALQLAEQELERAREPRTGNLIDSKFLPLGRSDRQISN